MIGVAISTRNRRAVFNRSIAHWRRRMPPDSMLVVVDDASDDPVSDMDGIQLIRNEHRLGVAMTKNRGITVLMDAGCEHLFLADDDIHPVSSEWWSHYVESPEPHLSAQWLNSGYGRGKHWDSHCNDGRHYTVGFPRGVMLYVQRDVVDKLGGMDPAHGCWGGEHLEFQMRIHAAGLTTWPYADVLESPRLWHEIRTRSSFPNNLRRRALDCNGCQLQKPRPRFVPYRENVTVQDFTPGPQIPDDREHAVLTHILDLVPTGAALEYGPSVAIIAERMSLTDSGYIGLVHVNGEVLDYPDLQPGAYVVFAQGREEQPGWREHAQRVGLGWTVVGHSGGDQWGIRIT